MLGSLLSAVYLPGTDSNQARINSFEVEGVEPESEPVAFTFGHTLEPLVLPEPVPEASHVARGGVDSAVSAAANRQVKYVCASVGEVADRGSSW